MCLDDQAWNRAPQAAGKIHTDIERGFTGLKFVSFDDLVACTGGGPRKGAGSGLKEKSTS